jgi:predicted PurR-regulated permease PerM
MQEAQPKPPQLGGASPLAATLAALPWEKVTLWAGILLAAYLLRHFVFIVLMTFLLCTAMRSVIGRIVARLSPHRERAWLERGLAVAGFAVLLGGFTVVATYLGPRLFRQANELVGRLSKLNPELEFQSVLSQTVGAYLFRLEYGGPGNPEYDAALGKFEKGGLLWTDDYRSFPRLQASLRGGFETTYEAEAAGRLRSEMLNHPPADELFDQWYLHELSAGAPAAALDAGPSRAAPQEAALPSASETATTAAAALSERQAALEEIKSDPEMLADWKQKWRAHLLAEQLAKLRRTPAYEKAFSDYYHSKHDENPYGIPYDYKTFIQLERAYPNGEKAFAAALEGQLTGDADDRRAHVRAAFERHERNLLADKWWTESSSALFLREHAASGLGGLSGSFASSMRDAVAFALGVPLQLLIALFLSFFITFDFPSLRKGVASLQKSRIKPFYDEIAPELVSFARLIGLAFYAQSLVAVVNSILTYLAMVVIGIDHPLVLSVIVFVCSFIPVFGVILSGIPIVIVAIVQPGGSIIIALYMVAVILAIHFIESNVLNPRIVGHVLHLHPVLVLVVLLVAEHFFGVWGLLLGMPVAVYVISHVILGEPIPGVDTPPEKIPKGSAAI